MQYFFVVSLLSCLLTLFAIPPTTAVPTASTPAQCVSSLSCTYNDFNAMSMNDRLTFIRSLESQHGPAFNAPDQWRNIEGIIAFFIDNHLGAPGSWVSYTDSAILEGIERGFAIASGLSTDTFGSPCSNLWAGFLTDLKAGKSYSLFFH